MRTKRVVLSLMFWSTRRLSWREFEGRSGADSKPTGPLLGKGTNALSSVAALGLTGTMSPGKGSPVALLIGNVQLEAATALKLTEVGSHSLKSPLRMRGVGALAFKTVPSRYRSQVCVQKKKVFDLSVL